MRRENMVDFSDLFEQVNKVAAILRALDMVQAIMLCAIVAAGLCQVVMRGWAIGGHGLRAVKWGAGKAVAMVTPVRSEQEKILLEGIRGPQTRLMSVQVNPNEPTTECLVGERFLMVVTDWVREQKVFTITRQNGRAITPSELESDITDTLDSGELRRIMREARAKIQKIKENDRLAARELATEHLKGNLI